MNYYAVKQAFEFKLFEFKNQNDIFKKFNHKIWMLHNALGVYLWSPSVSQ